MIYLVDPNVLTNRPPCPFKCATQCATLCGPLCGIKPLYGIDPTPI